MRTGRGQRRYGATGASNNKGAAGGFNDDNAFATTDDENDDDGWWKSVSFITFASGEPSHNKDAPG